MLKEELFKKLKFPESPNSEKSSQFCPLPIPGFVNERFSLPTLNLNLKSPNKASFLNSEITKNHYSIFNYLSNNVSKRFSKRAQSDPWITNKFFKYYFNRRYTLGTDYFQTEASISFLSLLYLFFEK